MLEGLTIDKLKELLKRFTPGIVQSNRAFFEGDHWQNGDGWIGPRPAPGEAGAQNTFAELQRAFTSSNKIREVTSRHADGVIGREPAWSFVPVRPLRIDEEPTPAEQTAIDEIEAALTEWWNDRDVHNVLISAATDVTWATRGSVRLFVPAGLLEKNTNTLKAADLAAALRNVFVEHPKPENSLLWTDPLTGKEASVVIYSPEPLPGSSEQPKERAEISFQSETTPEMTVIRVIDESSSTDVELPIGGRTVLMEAARTLLVTEQVQQNQRALNLALSMVPRNVVTGGFLERMMLNAQQPGTWDLDEAGQPIPGTFKPHPFRTGAGTTQFVAGIIDVDESSGVPHRSEPSVNYREPVPVVPSVDAVTAHEFRILNEVKQLHVLMNDDADASGVSRREARIDFVSSLMRSQPGIQKIGRWLMETALAFAEAQLGSPGKWSNAYRCDFNCRLNAGVITPDEQAQNLAAVEKGMLSREMAMALNGIDDVDAAIAQINSSPEAQLSLFTKQAAVMKTLTDAGASLEAAAQFLQLEPKIVRILAASVAEVTGEEDDAEAEDEGATGQGGGGIAA